MSLDNVIATSTGSLAAGNNDVRSAVTVVHSVTITPAAADATVSIQPNGGGTSLWDGIARSGGNSVHVDFPRGLNCPGGLRVVVAGAGAVGIATYS